MGVVVEMELRACLVLYLEAKVNGTFAARTTEVGILLRDYPRGNVDNVFATSTRMILSHKILLTHVSTKNRNNFRNPAAQPKTVT